MDLLGPKFAQIYGQGEVPMTITALPKAMHADRERPRWREIMGSVGLPRTNVEVRVADDDDRDLADRRNRRGAGPRRSGDERLLEKSAGHR